MSKRSIITCDSPGCGQEVPERTDSFALVFGMGPSQWLKLAIVGGADHHSYDLCPGCAGKIRDMLPVGPERDAKPPEPPWANEATDEHHGDTEPPPADETDETETDETEA